MLKVNFRTLVLGAALLLPACSFSEEALWPSLTGEDPAGGQSQPAQQVAAPEAAAPAQPAPARTSTRTVAQAPAAAPASRAVAAPPLGTSNFQPTGVTSGEPTGTFVGKKVTELRDELKKLQSSISQHNSGLQQIRVKTVQDSQRYHGGIAAISTRLQVGTTPGNPILVQQYSAVQADLDRLAGDVGEMNKLATSVTGDSTLSAFLSESTRAAFGVSGAIDEDHRQLAILEDEVNRTVVLIDRLLKEVTEDVRRQTNYVGSERGNLNMLAAGIKTGEIYGASLGNRALASAAPIVGMAGAPMETTGRRPLVVIRFDRRNVPYQQALYSAVGKVLEQRPGALFDLVAVSPDKGGAARVALASSQSRRHAESVLRSLIEMGLAPSRVAVSGKTSNDARGSEVHLYLR